jgi:hypothetical protein
MYSSETSIDVHWSAQRCIWEYTTLHNHRCEDLKYNSVIAVCVPADVSTGRLPNGCHKFCRLSQQPRALACAFKKLKAQFAFKMTASKILSAWIQWTDYLQFLTNPQERSLYQRRCLLRLCTSACYHAIRIRIWNFLYCMTLKNADKKSCRLCGHSYQAKLPDVLYIFWFDIYAIPRE